MVKIWQCHQHRWINKTEKTCRERIPTQQYKHRQRHCTHGSADMGIPTAGQRGPNPLAFTCKYSKNSFKWSSWYNNLISIRYHFLLHFVGHKEQGDPKKPANKLPSCFPVLCPQNLTMNCFDRMRLYFSRKEVWWIWILALEGRKFLERMPFIWGKNLFFSVSLGRKTWKTP